MKHILLTLAAACFMTAANAQTQDYKLDIGDFHEITVANNIPVVYKNSVDSAGMALYSCEPSVASSIAFSNDKAKLKIQYNQDSEITTTPVITLYSSTLTKVTNWGDSTIVIEQLTPTSSFKAKVIGNGDISVLNLVTTKAEAAVQAGSGHIYISGKAQNAKFELASAGSIEGGNLEATQVTCSLVGTGSIDCYPTEKLSVRGLGSGKVLYKGDPKQVKNHGVGIKLIKID